MIIGEAVTREIRGVEAAKTSRLSGPQCYVRDRDAGRCQPRARQNHRNGGLDSGQCGVQTKFVIGGVPKL